MRTPCLLTVILLSAPACTGSGPQDPARSAANKATPGEATGKATPVAVTAPVTPPVTAPVTPPATAPVTPPATAPVTPPATPPASEVPAADAVAVAPPGLADEVPAIAGDTAAAAAPAEGEAPTVAVQAITATPTTVAWREVARPASATTFEPLTRGVLARSAGGYSDVDDSGALVLRPEIQAPPSPVLGSWPDNAWYVETRSKILPGDRSMTEIRDMRLMRLRGKKRWVPQEYNGAQRFPDEGESVQIGGAGGLIVEQNGSLTRLSDNGSDPVLGLDRGGDLVGFFETRSGRVYTVRQVDAALYVQRDCADLECVAREAKKLPLGTQWSFTQPVTRQQHSVSVVAEVRVDEGTQAHLLHHETGGWKLESVASAPSGLWPTKDGGLWTMIGAQLLHRDPGGAWREVALPAGATAVTAAMRNDYSELWIAATVDNASVVFATAANAQAPAPAPAAP